ncbi:hypothetical protein GMORB2_0723, partial [Geosmithia morbida]
MKPAVIKVAAALAAATAASGAGAVAVPGSQQRPLTASGFSCSLPPVIDPSSDGLPSAESLFSSREALERQVERHQAVVRVPTVSYDDLGPPGEDDRWAPFFDLHAVLEKLYPNLHKRASLEKVNTLGLVYTILGTDVSLKPTLLAAHQDVVPVADASTWTHPPFAAVYDGEWIWGRGASDDKNSLTALLSAVEALLSPETGWTPRRTLILAFGFDEECSGLRGAASISRHLQSAYGTDSVAVILDEGGTGLGPVDGDDSGTLYAVPAVMEKGHVDVWFDLSVAGGHSSFPFPHTGIGIAAEIITALEANPWSPAVLDDSPVHRQLQCQARHSPGADAELTRLVRERDLDGLARRLAASGRVPQYMVQTSQAVDTIRGGQKINAMPEAVSLGVNYRVAPQDSIPRVMRNVVDVIAPVVDRYGLRLRAYEGDADYDEYRGGDALPRYDVDYNGTLVLRAREKTAVTPISPTSGPVWDLFSGAIQHSYATESGAPVVPVGIIMTGNTDTRHYLDLSPNIYRWTPARQGTALNIHTVDERVRMDGHIGMVKFYYNFVRTFDQADI